MRRATKTTIYCHNFPCMITNLKKLLLSVFFVILLTLTIIAFKLCLPFRLKYICSLFFGCSNDKCVPSMHPITIKSICTILYYNFQSIYYLQVYYISLRTTFCTLLKPRNVSIFGKASFPVHPQLC